MPPSFQDSTRSKVLSQHLATALLTRLDLTRSPIQRVERGRWLRRSSERLDALPYIVAGRLDAIIQVGDEGVQVIPVTFGIGEIAVLSALFSKAPVHGELIAAEAVQLRWLLIADVESTLLADKELLVLLVRFLAQRLREVRARERGWLERSVHGRVCAALARLALDNAPQSGEAWLLPATHEHLALRCGVSRPKLSNELKRLERAGVLKLRRGTVELIDYAALGDND